eukprot:TRINITY_DN3922_c0_g1_i1.p1 TRINITY_DN3922_c0_g1~~TRINITY_DN3922_c0_g1_i1.p1  ORF type:complete len:450 (-),score=76.47 TRINITY_DN3922_c0_g1_i1:177-1493(-)
MSKERYLMIVFVLLFVGDGFCQEIEGFGEEDEEVEYKPSQRTADIQQNIPGSTERMKRTQDMIWDEDEFEGLPTQQEQQDQSSSENQKRKGSSKRARQPIFNPSQQEHWYYEILAVTCLLLYAANIWRGARENESIAIAWAKEFCMEGALMPKNFALLGPGDIDDNGEILMRESQNIYKFYASGRRCCQGLLATLNLQARQDILSLLISLAYPKDDQVEIQVFMNDVSMPPMVMAAGTSKAMKQLMTEKEDLASFARKIDPPKDQLQGWPGEKLVVLTDSTQVFLDIMNDSIMNQVFRGRAFEEVGKYFRYFYFTSENTEGTQKKVLNFSFKLPPKKKMENISRLMNSVMMFIDSVGSYDMPADLRKRAEKRRAELEKKNQKEGRLERETALAEKKAESKRLEKERIRKMGPEALERYEEREKRQEYKKAIKKMTKKA